MNTPAQRHTLNKEKFRDLLKQASFAKAGDNLERRYCSHLHSEFSRIEEFWRVFVVPLTNRLTGDKPEIHFRDGVDPTLQYICGANYSLFVHLSFAKVILAKWGDASLDAVYTRLGSALDVFEALVIKFHLLMSECRGMKSPILSGLSERDFVVLAKQYYKKKYPELQKLYLEVGKQPPPIRIPTKRAIFDEYFDRNPLRKHYHTVSGDIRAFRNAIVHDVRVGRLVCPDKSIRVPKSDASVISRYRQWNAIEQASRDEETIARDFCEVKVQCANDVARTVKVLNGLYEYLLSDFDEEFYTEKRSRCRDFFGIAFSCGSPSTMLITSDMLGRAASGSFTYSESAIIGSGSFIPPPKGTS